MTDITLPEVTILSRSTVADGNSIQKNTIGPLTKRDEILKDAIENCAAQSAVTSLSSSVSSMKITLSSTSASAASALSSVSSKQDKLEFGYNSYNAISSINNSALAGGNGTTYTSPYGTLYVDNDAGTLDATTSAVKPLTAALLSYGCTIGANGSIITNLTVPTADCLNKSLNVYITGTPPYTAKFTFTDTANSFTADINEPVTTSSYEIDIPLAAELEYNLSAYLENPAQDRAIQMSIIGLITTGNQVVELQEKLPDDVLALAFTTTIPDISSMDPNVAYVL